MYFSFINFSLDAIMAYFWTDLSIMKTMKWALVGFLTVSTTGVFAQAEIFSSLKEAIKANNGKDAVKYFNQSVDINLEGEVNTYSKAQAEFVLRDFFKKHPEIGRASCRERV